MISGREFNEERDDSIGIVLSSYCIIGNITNYNNNFRGTYTEIPMYNIIYDGRSRDYNLDN